eukprot:TRINITY_DN24372_c0_g1_i1.p1 TRINITY_DN24372_c0_g1~~TRINITY_DN24372_c0_g1_i1.p1  ORF type:complete len:322 (-),score=82.93 TRINITY_DN24372_c0_g1_i1:301-1266(-)
MPSILMSCTSILVVVMAVLAAPLYYTFFPAKVYDIKGTCAVVTGASDGIGVNIAMMLARDGVTKLVIAARRLEKLEEVKAKILAQHPKTDVKAIRLDVGDRESRISFLEQVTNEVGPCEILVNNAAIERNGEFDKQAEDVWEQVWKINVHGVMHLTQSLMPGMLKAGRGHIVNVASLAGLAGVPYNVIYATSKHALVGFTSSIRAEFLLSKKPITAHVICPGFITETGMAANNAARIQMDLDVAADVFGKSAPDDSAQAVVNAIVYDEPSTVVNFPPVRPLFAVGMLFPRFNDVMYKYPAMFGLDKAMVFFEKAAGVVKTA